MALLSLMFQYTRSPGASPVTLRPRDRPGRVRRAVGMLEDLGLDDGFLPDGSPRRRVMLAPISAARAPSLSARAYLFADGLALRRCRLRAAMPLPGDRSSSP